MHKLRRYTAFVAWMTLLTGCAATHLSVERVRPAELDVPRGTRLVARVFGPGGPEMTDRLLEALIATNRFVVLDRQHLGALIAEHDLSRYGELDEPAFAPLLSAGTLLFGQIYENRYDEDVNAVEATRTLDGRSVPVINYTRAGTHRLGMRLRIVDASGRIAAIRRVGAQTADKSTGSAPPPRITEPRRLEQVVPRTFSPARLRSQAMEQTVATVLRLVAPYTVRVDVVFYHYKQLPDLAEGIRAVQHGDWPNSLVRFRSAVAAADQNGQLKAEVRARAHYDLAVALGYSGAYDEGLAEMDRALQIRPEDGFYQEANKIRQFKADAERLRALDAEPPAS